MRKDRIIILRSMSGLAASMLAVSVSAQPPMPVPRPLPPTGPAPQVYCEPGPVHRAANHTWNVLQDNLVGYPAEFAEPPLGFYRNEIVSVMKAKAAPHRFTLYRSDFLAGSTKLSPAGAGRFNLMASRLRGWLGPISVEWSPDEPGIAEARREAVLSMLQQAGMPVIMDRVVIGPSPYPGSLGGDAETIYSNRLSRGVQYGQTFPSATGGGGGGSGGGR